MNLSPRGIDLPPTPSDCLLSIQDLGKQYRRDVWGLRHFSLDLRPGIIGLLGPNGAGKSTLMRMLATITQPSEGRILWKGVDVHSSPDALRDQLGYLPQDFGIYPNLTAVEFLDYIAAIKGLPRAEARRRIDELLQVVNLTEAARRPLGGYSGGMKQRIGIAQALLNDPRVLIVDEPTVGLDPEERVRFRGLLADLAGERIILLSTHIVSDVEATAAEIVLISRGSLVTRDTPEALLASLEGRVWSWVAPAERLAEIRQGCLVTATLRRADGMLVRAVSPAAPDAQAQPAAPTLEDVYLYLVGQAERGQS
jgi:ABC-2 type transport system ATP-binding protein